MSRAVTPSEAKTRLHEGGEVAFLDVREAGQFGEGHPLFAVPCPYSRLEVLLPSLVPNPGVTVLLLDDGDGIAESAARAMEGLGYRDVATVAGGVPGWAAAGFTLYKGVNVPSKTLGEFVEHARHPPTIPPDRLDAWRRDGVAFRLFDVRPPSEYRKMTVPGARCVPNGELAHRLPALVPDPGTPIVVTCAGRTRGLIGVAGLQAAGVSNPVYALENGTQGWALAGHVLDRENREDPLPELDPEALAGSRARARDLAAREGVRWIDAAGFEALAADPGRSLYLFDVRSPQEYAAGHAPGAVHALGGQLAQATDQWVGIRRARIVLADDTGMRATLAAMWLALLGYETYVLPDATEQAIPPDWLRKRPHVTAPVVPPLPEATPEQVAADLAQGRARLLDLRGSMVHRRGHPAGAAWAIRPRLASTLGGFRGRVYLLADEPEPAQLVAQDLRRLGGDAALLAGGLEAWRAAGLPVGATQDRPTDAEAIDFLFFVHDRHDGNLESSRRYLAWEQGLIAQLDAAERAEFRLADG